MANKRVMTSYRALKASELCFGTYISSCFICDLWWSVMRHNFIVACEIKYIGHGIPLETHLCGLTKLIKSLVSAPRRDCVRLRYSAKWLYTHKALSKGYALSKTDGVLKLDLLCLHTLIKKIHIMSQLPSYNQYLTYADFVLFEPTLER